jgi:hypothetical protein
MWVPHTKEQSCLTTLQSQETINSNKNAERKSGVRIPRIHNNEPVVIHVVKVSP